MPTDYWTITIGEWAIEKNDLRVNRRISVREVRLVDETGGQVGVVSTLTALKMAQEKGLDLVEVSPNARPPVCKIMDYGKYKYQEKKRQQEAKKSRAAQQVKEVKFRLKIDTHDLETKEKAIKSFLEAGHKVKITLQLRGREVLFRDRAMNILQRVITDCEDTGTLERVVDSRGRLLFAYMVPKAPPKPQKK